MGEDGTLGRELRVTVTYSARYSIPRTLLIVAASVAGFVLLQHPARVVESHAVAGLLSLAGASGTHVVLGTDVQVLPAQHGLLLASVTPSCSSLASLLAISCLAAASGVDTRLRRLKALLIALAVIAVGNVLRMAASLGIGFVAGRSVLLLFHDWVAGIFTFGYVLAGYVLFLYLVLPDRRRSPADGRAAVAA
jgi:exosortase/archaeosortase family protein